MRGALAVVGAASSCCSSCPVLSNAPPVEAIGVAPRSMSQHSHIRLEERHLELAIEALAGVGR